MLKNEDIVCISSIDWDFLWQGHQEIMTRLARNGNRVLFIENTGVRVPTLKDFVRIKNRIYNWMKGVHGIRKIEEGLYVYSPLVLPFPYLKLARPINKRIIFSVLFKWLKAVGFSEPVVWVFLPTGLSLDIINEIAPKVIIYYCIDSFEASSREAAKIKYAETLMLQRADLVFATSQELFDHCAQHNKNVHYFPFGVNIDNFMSILEKPYTIPSDLLNVKKPIAGYIGGIHKWIDFDLVRYIAEKNRDISFVFCGPIQADINKVKGLANVIFLGKKDPAELPGYVREFDIALIPYRITEYTRNVYPTKLNEYLSLGKPVISTNLPEVINFNSENVNNVVKISDTKEGFNEDMRAVLERPISEEEKALAISLAKKNSWSDRVEKMSLLIEKMISEKAKERERSWKYNLYRIYKNTRRRLIPAVIVLGILYLALFHTPIIWLLADPLKIADTPHKADVIVALGGGVGESGKVGQGYEERVNSAVKLYRGGFTNKIIYSSGFKYIMKEAQIMKVLSVSMGVNKDDIMMDDSAVNTYEMIMHLKEFMGKNNWNSAILISSPYHMRRLKLLCDKHLKGVNIYYVPVEQSSFYEHGSEASLMQVRGILHECLAIIYYKMKGYV